MRENRKPHSGHTYRSDFVLGLWRTAETSTNALMVDEGGLVSMTTHVGTILVSSSLFGRFDHTGVVQGARQFNGASYQRGAAIANYTDLHGEWTVEAWVKPSTVATDQCIVDFGQVSGASSTGNSLMRLFVGPDGVKVRWENGTRTQAFLLDGGVIQAGVTYHVAARKKAQASGYGVYLYINGVQVAFNSAASNATGGSTSHFVIGAAGNAGGGANHFSGYISDVRVSKVALSDEAIYDSWARGVCDIDGDGVTSCARYGSAVRVKVYDGGGQMRSLNDIAGYNFVDSVSLSEDIDGDQTDCEIVLRREVFDLSLSPLKVSVLNDPEPLIQVRRRLLVEALEIPDGTTPSAVEHLMMPIFDGRITAYDPSSEQMKVSASDKMHELLTTMITPQSTGNPPYERVYCATGGGANSPVAPEVLIPSIIADSEPANGWTMGSHSLWTPTPTAALRNGPYTTSSSDSVGTAIIDLAQSLGWNLKYRWDDYRKEFRLKLYSPDRFSVWSTGDSELQSSDIIDSSTYRFSLDDIRTAGSIIYTDLSVTTPRSASEPERRYIYLENTPAVSKYGLITFRVDVDQASGINTAAAATVMLNAILTDVANPMVDFSVTTRQKLSIEIQDFIKIKDGSLPYIDGDFNVAVYGLTRTWSKGDCSLELKLRAGPPAARGKVWVDEFISFNGVNPIATVQDMLPPTIVDMRELPEGVWVDLQSMVGVPGRKNYVGAEVFIGTTFGFTPGPNNYLGTIYGKGGLVSGGTIAAAVEPNTSRYIKIRAFDSLGNKSAFTQAQFSARSVTRVAAAHATRTSAMSISPGKSTSKVTFNATSTNQRAAYNTSTGDYTAERDGMISVSSACRVALTGMTELALGVFVNGTLRSFGSYVPVDGVANTYDTSVAAAVRVSAGDVVSVRVYSNSAGGGSVGAVNQTWASFVPAHEDF